MSLTGSADSPLKKKFGRHGRGRNNSATLPGMSSGALHELVGPLLPAPGPGSSSTVAPTSALAAAAYGSDDGAATSTPRPPGGIKRRSTSTISVSETTRRVMERRALREELNLKLAEILARPFARLPVATDIPRLRKGFKITTGTGAVIYDEALDSRTASASSPASSSAAAAAAAPILDDERTGTMKVMKAIVGAVGPQSTSAGRVSDFEYAFQHATEAHAGKPAIPGQLAEQLRPLLANGCPGIGETSLVASVLKTVCQDCIFPAVVVLHSAVYTKGFPFKDSKGSWRIHVRVISETEVVVTHVKRQQSVEAGARPASVVGTVTPARGCAFEFEWALEIHLRGTDSPTFYANCHVTDFEINDSLLPSPQKKVLVDVLGAILHPRAPFVSTWRRQDVVWRPWVFLTRTVSVHGPGGELLFETPRVGYVFRESVYFLFLAIATALDAVAASSAPSPDSVPGRFASRVREAWPEGVFRGPAVAYWQFLGEPHLSLIFRLLTDDFLEPASARLRSIFPRHPFRPKPFAPKHTRLSISAHGEVEVRHTQTEVSTLPGHFEFSWEFVATVATGFVSLNVSLRITDLAFFDLMPDNDRDDFILCSSEVIDRSTLNRCVLLMPLRDALKAVRTALEGLPPILVAQDQLGGGLGVPATDLLREISLALQHVHEPLPTIPVKKGDVSELLLQSASPRVVYRKTARASVPSPLATTPPAKPLPPPPFPTSPAPAPPTSTTTSPPKK